MIKRVWRGWATNENAGSYFDVLTNQVIPGIEAKNIPGLKGVEVLRKDNDDEVEFMTIITFDSIQNVIEFQGEEYTRAYIPDAAKSVLKRWEDECIHYEKIM